MSLASKVGRGCAGRGPRPRRGGRLRSFMQPCVSWWILADTSMRIVSRTSYGICRERAAMHAAVPGALARGRPGDAPVLLPCCCRRRRGNTDNSRASGACSAQPERLRACSAALLVHFRDGRRALAGQPPPTSLPNAICATTTFPAGQGRELCLKANEESGLRSEEID